MCRISIKVVQEFRKFQETGRYRYSAPVGRKVVLLRYFKCDIDSNVSFKPTYYIAANEWFTNDEIILYTSAIAQGDYLTLDEKYIDLDDDEDIEFALGDITPISKEEMWGVMFSSNFVEQLDIQHLDSRDSVLMVGRVFKNRPSKLYYHFAANGGQDSEVSAIGIVDSKTTLNTAYENGYNDCMTQLKRYFQATGLDICTGTFVVQNITEDEYEFERASREIVFDS